MRGMRREKPPKLVIMFTLENKTGKWRDFVSDDEGSENTYVQVTEISRTHFIIECDQYYSSGGICKLEITQNLQRALATFKALLLEDTKQEDLDCEESRNRIPYEARVGDTHSRHF